MAEAKDSGTESVGRAVEPEAETVTTTDADTTSEETPVAEETSDTEGLTPEAEEAPEPEATSGGQTLEEAPAAPEPEPVKTRKRLPRSLRHKHSKPKREKPATRKPITRTAGAESTPSARQERRGIVVSDKGEKTIIVSVDVTKLHPKYKKVVRRTRKFHAHDEKNEAGVGDVVRIVESRPISKTKNWRLAEVVEKAK